MDSAVTTQQELFSKFMVAYDRVESETGKVGKLIPTPEKIAERERAKLVPTMSGKKRVLRGGVEEQLSEVEGIIDHLGSLTENIDEASAVAKRLAEADPVPGAVEIDIEDILGETVASVS